MIPSTFDAADSPQPRVRQVAFDFLGLRLALVRGGVGGVADVRPRVEPVVGADGDGHEAEGSEGPRDGQQSLDPSVTPCHGGSWGGSWGAQGRRLASRPFSPLLWFFFFYYYDPPVIKTSPGPATLQLAPARSSSLPWPQSL